MSRFRDISKKGNIMNSDFELTIINKKISECIQRGVIGIEPIKILFVNNSFIPKEGLLWDYKEQLNIDTLSLAKTVLQIVSLHNTYGGYLIYGVKEEIKDKKFSPISLDLSNFDPSQLRNKIKDYTGISINFTFSEVKLDVENSICHLGIILVSKREASHDPIKFIKNGPEKKPSKLLFCKDEIYFRNLDENKKANDPSDWKFIYSPRNLEISKENKQTLSHNLPDKNLICSNFVGRKEVLSKLWAWLSEDFEYIKILSGDGGKGKTSIAYKFCQEFIQLSPIKYERVVWVSAKEKQFSGMANRYYDIQESDFEDLQSFLTCLADHCALDTSSYAELSIQMIKKELKFNLPTFPSLIVVDDIDSLQEDEQRRVVDSCRQLGDDSIRFLITTRKKLAYSSDICIDVLGFDENDFIDYVDTLILKYDLKEIKRKEVLNLYENCDGSPLLSASILRLYKQGISLNTAIKEWKGQVGEDARNAAIRREIDSLSRDSKRILLIIFYYKNCSFSEIKQVAGIENNKLLNCIEELQSLFLVNEPRIIDSEERFSISNTTYLVVSESRSDMAFDYQKLQKQVQSNKESPTGKKSGNLKRIGFVINQSMALIKESRIQDAIETVETELRSLPKNPDLLLMKARCLMKLPTPNFDTIRKLIIESIKHGQRKELAYDIWYEVESSLKSYNGMVECASQALQTEGVNNNAWRERKANGYILRSQYKTGDALINDLMEASSELNLTLSQIEPVEKSIRIQEINDLNDFIWEKLESDYSFSWLSSFDKVYIFIKRGDARTKMYLNAFRCLREAKLEPNFTAKKEEAYNICVNKLISLLNDRTKQDKMDRPFSDYLERL